MNSVAEFGRGIARQGMELVRRVHTFAPPNFSYPSGNPNQESGNYVVTPWGEKLGYLVQTDPEIQRLFPEYQRALIDFSDRRSTDIHRGHTRKMGGLFKRHPELMKDIHYGISQEVTEEISALTALPYDDAHRMVTDYRFVIALWRHDDLEDPNKLKKLERNFKKASRAYLCLDESVMSDSPEHVEMKRLKDKLGMERKKLVENEDNLIREFLDSMSLDERVKRELYLGAAFAMGIDDHAARHIEENLYSRSTWRLSSRYDFEAYKQDGIGGPFQVPFLTLLGISGAQKEPADYFLARLQERLLDRIAISREINPTYDDSQFDVLTRLFNDNPWLIETYGNPKQLFGMKKRPPVDGIPMPELHEILYRNFLVFHNTHDALMREGTAIVVKKREEPLAYAYLLGIVKALPLLIGGNDDIVRKARDFYEQHLPPKQTRAIQRRVANMNSHRLTRVDGYGPISNGFRYDKGMDHNTGDESMWIQNYEDFLIFSRLNTQFSSPKNNRINTRTGEFRLFTIKGLEDGGITFRDDGTSTGGL